MYSIVNIEQEKSKYFITFISDRKVSDVKLSMRVIDNDRFILSVPKEEKIIDVEEVNSNYRAEIDKSFILNLKSKLSKEKEYIWLHVKEGNNYHELKINKKLQEKIKKFRTVKLNELSTCRLFTRANNTIGIVVNINKISCTCEDLIINQNQLKIKVNSTILDNKVLITDMYFAKRVFKNVLRYGKKYKLKNIKNNEFELSYNEFNFNDDDKECYLDLIAEIKMDNIIAKELVSIRNIRLDKETINTGKWYKSVLYRTSNNTLAIRVEEKINYIECKNYYVDDNKLLLELEENKDFSGFNIELYRKMPIDTYYEYYKVYENKLDGNIATIDFSKIFNYSKLSCQHEYILKISSDNDKYLIRNINENMEKNIIKINNIKISINNNMEIKACPDREKTIRLAVLGSCFSRAAFNSVDKYFNPNYKEHINIVYSDFWYSVISDRSKKINFDSTKYNDVKIKNLNNISRLYLKDSLQQLQNTEADYILIDFFVDAVHGVRKFNDGNIIGQNPELHQSKYYKNNLTINTENFDFRNLEYFNKWKIACDELIAKLDEIVGLDKVILSTSFLVDKFFDENGQVKSFIKEKNFKAQNLKYYNSIWSKMNNYFLVKAPQAKVIDMSKFNYISSYDHPVNCGPHHFESDYYKTFFRQVLKCMLEDTIK